MIKVSVVVPIYNVEQYLDKCLHHLVNQTLEEIEIICVNDGSTDQSQVIIDRYVEKYPNKVRGFVKPNGGLSDARNYGLQYATGEFVMFPDSDDWLSLEALEKMYVYATTNQYEVVVCGVKIFNEYGKELESFATFNTPTVKKEDLLLQVNLATNLLMKKYLLDEIKFPVGIWYEDLATIPIILSNVKEIGTINQHYYNYLYRDNSITRTYSMKVLDILTAFDLILSCEGYTKSYLQKFCGMHIYFTILRANQIQNKEEQFQVLEHVYNYINDKFTLESFKKEGISGGLNQKLIMSLFLNRQFKVLMTILSFEWKIKKFLVSKK